ncbi:MAG: class I SAM-dependent methyltransferase [bacterium]|jgi:SAM-dependent methyltransferase|nr:class I SAM-dependent methyltransferase [bacterium]
MVEYFLLLMGVILLGPLCQALGIAPQWLFLGMIGLGLPSVYALWDGAPWVPTDPQTVRRMLELAAIQPGQRVMDLGCGDGRIVRAAHHQGTMAIGYEISVIAFLVAWGCGRGQGRIIYGDFWKADVAEADVIFWYQMPRSEARFFSQIWPRLKPGCKVIVNTFAFRSIAPDQRCGTISLYIKPANTTKSGL